MAATALPQDYPSATADKIRYWMQVTNGSLTQEAATTKVLELEPDLAAGSAPAATATPAKTSTDLLTYNAAKVNAKLLERFTTQPNKARDDYRDASFIKGAKTEAERKAYAIKLANTTITKGMSAADAAAINKARLWYTGQTKGGKQQAWADDSLKSIRRGKKDKGRAAPKTKTKTKTKVKGETITLTAVQKRERAARAAKRARLAGTRGRGGTNTIPPTKVANPIAAHKSGPKLSAQNANSGGRGNRQGRMAGSAPSSQRSSRPVNPSPTSSAPGPSGAVSARSSAPGPSGAVSAHSVKSGQTRVPKMSAAVRLQRRQKAKLGVPTIPGKYGTKVYADAILKRQKEAKDEARRALEAKQAAAKKKTGGKRMQNVKPNTPGTPSTAKSPGNTSGRMTGSIPRFDLNAVTNWITGPVMAHNPSGEAARVAQTKFNEAKYLPAKDISGYSGNPMERDVAAQKKAFKKRKTGKIGGGR